MDKLRKLENEARLGRISRRSFMARASALGIAGAAGVPLISERAMASSPSVGGRFRIGIGSGSSSDSMDPGTITDTYMQVVNYGLRNNLTEVTPDGELIGELAESFEASEDARSWTFRLRDGVEFHNGKTLDANDVLETMNHHRGEDSESGARQLFDDVEDIVADDDLTVTFHLAAGNADFPFIMNDYRLTICPVVDGALDLSGNGTGGYVLDSFRPGERTTMTRNPNYWKENAAFFESVEVLVMRDSTSRTNALTTGDIDVMNRVAPSSVDLVGRRGGARVEQTSGNQHYTFPMHVDREPFDDWHVRMAIKLAVDREQLLQTVLSGHGYVGNDHPIGRANRFHHDDLPQRQFDPEEARHHLREAGRENLQLTLKVSDAAFVGAVDAGQLMAETMAEAGIDLRVDRVPSDGYWSNVWLEEPFVASYWGGRATEDWMFTEGYAAGANWNDTNWENERFNELLREARAELDEDRRREMYHEMQELVHDDGGSLIPIFANYIMGLSDEVQHGEMANNWDLDGLKCLERWWFA